MQRNELDAAGSTTPKPAGMRGWYPWAVVGMLWFICFFNYADRHGDQLHPAGAWEKSSTSPRPNRGRSPRRSCGSMPCRRPWPAASATGNRKYADPGWAVGVEPGHGFTAGCTRLWQFVFVRGAEGLGETFYFPASMSLVSDYHAPAHPLAGHEPAPDQRLCRHGGRGLVRRLDGDRYNWRIRSSCLGAAGVVLGLVLAFFIREPQRNEAERLERGELDAAHPAAAACSQRPRLAARHAC